MSMTAYDTRVYCTTLSLCREKKKVAHARRAKGNPVPIPEPGSGTAYNSGPRKSVRRGNPK